MYLWLKGGVAGSIAAKFAAKHGLKTLLIEKAKTPRNKPCSGIKFSYFEKLIGEKIPREALCQNDLFKVEMVTPSNKVVTGKMHAQLLEINVRQLAELACR